MCFQTSMLAKVNYSNETSRSYNVVFLSKLCSADFYLNRNRVKNYQLYAKGQNQHAAHKIHTTTK